MGSLVWKPLNGMAFANPFKSASLKKVLEKYVEPDAIEKILDGDFDPRWKERRSIHFVFATIEARNAEEYSDVAGRVGGLARQFEGSVYGLVPLTVVVFSQPNPEGEEVRRLFASELREGYPDRVAAVHGAVDAEVGTFGFQSFMDLGFWWPGMMDALRELARMRAGEIRELQSD